MNKDFKKMQFKKSQSLHQLDTFEFSAESDSDSKEDDERFNEEQEITADDSDSAAAIWGGSVQTGSLVAAHKTDFLAASAQMQALHMVTRPGHWSPSNMSTILYTHPHCLADVNPHDLRLNHGHLVQEIYTAGHDNFHTISSKI